MQVQWNGCKQVYRFCLVLFVAILSLGSLSGAQAQHRKPARPKKSPAVPKRVMLFFPTETKGDKMAGAGEIVADVIKSRLASSDLFAPSTFRTSIASVRRAINEHTLTDKEVSGPFDSNQKIEKLMKVAGYDLAMSSSLDDFSFDAAKHAATVSISLTLIDLTQPKSKFTSIADLVTTPENSVKSADDPAAEQAARDLAEKLMTQLIDKARAKSPSQPMGKKN